jgi:hypothetical protein
MLINNMVSACVGLVPLVGDIVLAQYKANSRNAALLEEFLRIRGEELFKVEQDAGGQGSITKVGKTRDANGAPTAATQGATKTDGEETRPALGIDRRENDQTEVSIPAKKKTIASWFGKSTSIDKGKFVEDVNSGSGSGSDDKRD